MSAPRPATSPLRRHGPWLALVLLALAAYLPALRAGTIWDDNALTENPLIRVPGGLAKIWFAPSLNQHETHYWPLVYTTFWLEYRLWGLRPAGYHLINILLHALCGVLLWRVLRRIAVPGAWLAAAIFVLHPVHVESVAWIIERKDVLSGVFYLGAALAFLKYECGMRNAECGMKNAGIQNSEFRIQNEKTQLITCLLFIAALLSKSIAVTLPVGLALLLWFRDGRIERRHWRPLLTLFLIAVIAALADWAYSRSEHPLTTSGLTPPGRMIVASRAFWFYLGKLAWPHPLAALYPQWPVQPGSVAAWLPLAALIMFFAILWFARGRIGRAPIAAFAFFAVTLAPVLGIIEHNFMGLAWVADRFQYLASIGPIALVAAMLARRESRGQARNLENRDFEPVPVFRSASVKLMSIPLLLLLALLTWRQSATYRDSLTLFNHAVAAYPTSWAARFQLGLELSERKRYDDAFVQINEALRINPRPCAPIHYELARLLGRRGQFAEAERHYNVALKLDPRHPVIHNSLGVFLAGQGRDGEAFGHFREAVRLRPAYPDALSNLAGAYLRRGAPEAALGAARRAVAHNPYNADFRASLALACAANGQAAEAAAQYREALRLNPSLPAAHANLGGLLLEQGDAAGALPHLEAALRLGLGDATLHFMLGEACRRCGRPRDAAAHYAETLRLNPKHAEAAARKAECEL